MLEGVDETVVPVAKLVNVPVYTDTDVSPSGCAAGVIATTGGAADVDVDVDVDVDPEG